MDAPVHPTKKFMFDLNDFGEDALRAKAQAARKPTFSQEEMEASRQTGFTEGRVAGLQEAIGSQEAQIRDLSQQIVMATERLAADESDRMATFIDQAALITVQALNKVLPVLLERVAVSEIASFVTRIYEEQVKAQTLSIYVHPMRVTPVTERLEAMAATMRRKTPWIIQGDPSLHEMQCKIEWTGGGADWDPQTVATRMLDAITAHLPEHLRNAANPPVTPEIDDTLEVMDASDQTPHTTDTPQGS